MKCYTVEKTEYGWDEPSTTIVGNTVYSSEEDARKAARKAFDDWLAANSPAVKSPGARISEKNGVYLAYSREKSVAVSVEEHEFADGKRG